MKIVDPFPRLLEIVKSYDMESLDIPLKKKVPFPVLLIKHLDEWKKTHDGKAPSGFEQQTQFRALVEEAGKQLPEEENYTEALQFLGSAMKKPNEVTDLVQEALDAARDTPTKNHYWTFVRALGRFIEQKKRTPLS